MKIQTVNGQEGVGATQISRVILRPYQNRSIGPMHGHARAQMSKYESAGLFTLRTAMIKPTRFVRTASAGLRSNSVSIHEGSKAIHPARQGTDWAAPRPADRCAACSPGRLWHLESFGFMTGRLIYVFTCAPATRPRVTENCRALSGQTVWGVMPAGPMCPTVRRMSGQGSGPIAERSRFTFDLSIEVSYAGSARGVGTAVTAFVACFSMLRQGLWSACCQKLYGTAKCALAGMWPTEVEEGLTSPACA